MPMDVPMEAGERVRWLPDIADDYDADVRGLGVMAGWLLVLYYRGDQAFLETLPWEGKERLTLTLPRPDPASLCPWRGADSSPRCCVSFCRSAKFLMCKVDAATSCISVEWEIMFAWPLSRISYIPSSDELLFLMDACAGRARLCSYKRRNHTLSKLPVAIMHGDLVLAPSSTTVIVGSIRRGKFQLYDREDNGHLSPRWTYMSGQAAHLHFLCVCENGGGWLFAVEGTGNKVHQVSSETGHCVAIYDLHDFRPRHVTCLSADLMFIDDRDLLVCRNVISG